MTFCLDASIRQANNAHFILLPHFFGGKKSLFLFYLCCLMKKKLVCLILVSPFLLIISARQSLCASPSASLSSAGQPPLIRTSAFPSFLPYNGSTVFRTYCTSLGEILGSVSSFHTSKVAYFFEQTLKSIKMTLLIVHLSWMLIISAKILCQVCALSVTISATSSSSSAHFAQMMMVSFGGTSDDIWETLAGDASK